MEKKNEFKFSTMRSFGSEQFSFTATVHSDNATLTHADIEAQTTQIGNAISTMFANTMKRELEEKAMIIEQSKVREEANKALNDQLTAELKSAEDMKKTGSKLEKANSKQ